MVEFWDLWQEASDILNSAPYTPEKQRRVHQIQNRLRTILDGLEQPIAPGGSPPVPLGPARNNGGTTN